MRGRCPIQNLAKVRSFIWRAIADNLDSYEIVPMI